MLTDAFPFTRHDHARCLKRLLGRADEMCARAGVRLTKLRRAVLRAVAGSHRAIGAYDIIDAMERDGQKPAPISVYRALDFLVTQGLVHKIESRNAFVACCHGEHAGDAVLMICEDCGVVAEMDAGAELTALNARAERHGFHARHAVTELSGICGACCGDV